MISKKLLIGGINADDSHLIIDTKEYLNALNFRFATSEKGNVGEGSNIEGNEILNNSGDFTLPAGTNQTVGAYEDRASRRMFFFNRNSNGSHGIYCYNSDQDTVYTVLLSSQVVGGLSFVSLIHSIAMFDNNLYWTDGSAWQKRVNVEAGIKLNHPSYTTSVAPYVLDKDSNTKMSSSVLNLIRNQPWAPLSVFKTTSSAANNFIKNDAFQFCYRFVYRDGEVSTFSPLSKLINFNTAAETSGGYNAINVSIPLNQKIEQDVKKIEIAVKYILGGSVFIIKEVTSGFSAHNAGTTQISYLFYNDSVGIAVDAATSVKQFDSVPITSNTLEIGKNRLFLGDNIDSYDTPSFTSLTASASEIGGATVHGKWYKIIYKKYGVIYTNYIVYSLDIGGTYDPGYYFPDIQPTLPIPSTSVDISVLNYAGGTQASIAAYLGIPTGDVYSISFYGPSITITDTGSTGMSADTITSGQRAFKTDSTYRLGIVFYDESGRKSGVVPGVDVKIPDRIYNATGFTTSILWNLDNNNNPASQIPSWATHYSIVRTKCLRVSQFGQLRADGFAYIEKNASTGVLSPVQAAYASTYYGLGIDVKSLFSVGIGYEFDDGDILKLYTSTGSFYRVAIKATFGSYIVTELIDLGNLTSATSVSGLYEFYKPYIGSTYELYYEIGETYLIDNPGLVTRKFSNVSGSISGDVYILQRGGSYYVEAMSVSDSNWSNWNTDIGRPNIVLTSGQTVKPVSVYYSNVRMSGTENNGLSTFETLSQYNLPSELKKVKRLILSSKVQHEGNVLVAIGEQETASVYIGEAQIFDNSGASFLATTSGVIGNINVLRGSYGTMHPESAFRWSGYVVFYDVNKGEWLKYDVNGLAAISRNKMSKYFQKSSQDILAYYRDPSEYNYANPGKELRVVGGVDPYHEEFLAYMPKMYLNPKNTRLSDMQMSSSSYSFTTVQAAISRTPSSLSFSYVVGSGPSTSSSFTFSGTNLTFDSYITVTGSTNFEVSKDGVAYYSSIGFPYTGITCSGTVYVRMKAGLSVASYGPQNITISGSEVTTTVAASGSVTAAPSAYLEASVSALSGFNYIMGSGPSAAQSFTINASSLSPSSGDITISASTSYEVSVTSSTSGYSSLGVTLAYTAGGTLASNTVWVRLKAGLSSDTYNVETIAISGGTANDSVVVSGSVGSLTLYAYPYSGWGSTDCDAVADATEISRTLYSTSDVSSFGLYSVVYANSGGTPLPGWVTKLYINSQYWNVSGGTITGLSETPCEYIP